MNRDWLAQVIKGPAFYRIAPFAAFMLCIAMEEGLALLHKHAVITLSGEVRIWLYVPRMALAGTLLFLFRRHYAEIDWKDLLNLRPVLISIATGILIFALWINMDWTLSAQATPPGFNPGNLPQGPQRWLMILLRCTGAIIVVPVMEELFWRSFLLRYLIDSNFMTVAVGRLTWFASLATILLFGLEHHYLFAGMMAGAQFTLVYWWTRSVVQCVVCHAMANLCLAIYVLSSAQWQFW